MLLDCWFWDHNPKANQELKEILGSKIDYLNLSTEIIEKFKIYEPQKLIWCEKSIQDFNAYMNDSRVGVMVGYGRIISLKRVLLNGNTVIYEMKGDSCEINDLDKFEELVVKKINCNGELKELLNKEIKINDN